MNEEVDEAMKGCNSLSSIQSAVEKRKGSKEGLIVPCSCKGTCQSSYPMPSFER